MVAVTVVMPVYNGADHLDRALESLSRQTFQDMRVVISDNASTDTTPEIIAKWRARDPRIVSYRQKENIGAAANYTWVLEQADSRWVMFSAHDDWWTPNYVEELHRVMVANPGAKLAAPMMTLIRADGTHNPCPFFDRLNKAVGIKRIVQGLTYANAGWYYGLCDRQALLSAWAQSKRFRYVWGADYIVLLPFILAGQVVGSNAAVYFKRETAASAVAHKPKTLSKQFDLYRNFLEVSVGLMWQAPLSLTERSRVLPMIVKYTNWHGWKPRRLLRGVAGLALRSVLELFRLRGAA